MKSKNLKEIEEAVSLLQRLIVTPSFSDEEGDVAEIWETWLKGKGVEDVRRHHNNIYALSSCWDDSRPVLLLNSHMDTVRPVASYSRNPFDAEIIDGRLYGLGSNDAGASGVDLALTFLKIKDRQDLPFNILLAISASEEKMGENGMRTLLPHLKEEGLYPDMAIVGEPTSCRAAIAERGLVVCDAEVKGVSGHAARDTGINAIYRACEDIEILKNISWEKESPVLGPIKVSVTMIDGGTQHNVVPDRCHFVADIRTTDAYSNEETVELLNKKVRWSTLKARSTRIRASVLDSGQPLALATKKAGIETFISPTTSDMALMYDIPSIKIGPGESERSHTADEFIMIDEIEMGLETYKSFINALIDILKG